MVAITVLTVGFLGISASAFAVLGVEPDNNERDNGTYLASEGIEIAKNLIDYDVHDPTAPAGGTCFTGRGTTDFQFDYTISDCRRSE